jgi:hypothetical protein
VRIARVAAAGRVQAARIAAEGRREALFTASLASAAEWVEDVRALGAVKVGTKICLAEGGKWRPVLTLEHAADSIARWNAQGDEVEAWGIDAAGEFVGQVW